MKIERRVDRNDITPEMIRAGLWIMKTYGSGVSDEKLVTAIFAAMAYTNSAERMNEENGYGKWAGEK